MIQKKKINGIDVCKECTPDDYGFKIDMHCSQIYHIKTQNIIKEIIVAPKASYMWSETEIVSYTQSVLDSINAIERNCQLFLKNAIVTQYGEVAVFHQGIIEYRRYKMLEVNIEISISGELFSEKLWITKPFTFYQIKNSIHEIIRNLTWKISFPLLFDQNSTSFLLINQKINCLALAQAASTLVHESIGHLFEADVFNAIDNHETFLGKKISTSDLTVIDYAKHPNCETQYSYDDDGTLCSNTPIIVNGVLSGILSDEIEQRSDFYKIAGFRRSSTTSGCPLIRMRNLVMEQGNFSRNELFQMLKEGLILLSANESCMTKEGNVLLNASALCVENYRIVGRIEKIQLKSSSIELIASIRHIGNSMHWGSLYSCNKYGETVYVSSGTPDFICFMWGSC